jgi:hypothetical protein
MTDQQDLRLRPFAPEEDVERVITPQELNQVLKRSKNENYQRKMYLRRKIRNKQAYDAILEERSRKLKQSILDAGGVLQSPES